MSIYTEDLETAYMFEQYDMYLDQHIENVQCGFEWLQRNIPEIIPDDLAQIIADNIRLHDQSKYSSEEYAPYAFNFYGKKTDEVKKNFDVAWNHHQKCNPHHWNYWVLVDNGTTKALDMPYEDIVEMFCDHWAFSWKAGNLREISNWYNSNKSKMIWSENTQKIYEEILNKVMKFLDESEAVLG